MSLPPPTVPSSDPPALVRAIGRWDLTAGVVNAVIGAGIFGLPATLATLTGAWSPVVVLAAGLATLVIVLCFAEVGSRFDQAGGPYLYARAAFGPFTGFLIGWLHIWTRIFTAAAILNVAVAYAVPFFPYAATDPGRVLVMTAIVGIATLVNVRGVRQAAWTVDLFTIGKLLPLLLLVVAGAAFVDLEVVAPRPIASVQWTEALVLAMFAYSGFESSLVAAGETRRPRSDTAFALIAGLAVIASVYVGVQVVVIGVLPDTASSTAPVLEALGRVLGHAGVVVGGLGALMSIYGWTTGFCLMTPRIAYAMAQAGELPGLFGTLHRTYRTPVAAIVLNAALALVLAMMGSFAAAATLSVVTRLGIFALTCAALPVLRRRSQEPAGFHVPGGTVVAGAGILYCFWMFGTRPLTEIWIVAAVLALGAAIWGVMWARGRL